MKVLVNKFETGSHVLVTELAQNYKNYCSFKTKTLVFRTCRWSSDTKDVQVIERAIITVKHLYHTISSSIPACPR